MFYACKARYTGMMVSSGSPLVDANTWLKRMFVDLSMQAELLKEALKK